MPTANSDIASTAVAARTACLTSVALLSVDAAATQPTSWDTLGIARMCAYTFARHSNEVELADGLRDACPGAVEAQSSRCCLQARHLALCKVLAGMLAACKHAT